MHLQLFNPFTSYCNCSDSLETSNAFTKLAIWGFSSDGSVSKIFDLGSARSIFCCSVQAGSAIFGLGLENFPWKYQTFPFGSKKYLRVGSKSTWIFDRSVCSGQGPSLFLGNKKFYVDSVTAIMSRAGLLSA